ncbi:hypothetical protein GCM10010313_37930 [Streptomyces violarus]|nr:hypothetical protein GCM10010313_37930 [Streptomyces violarus]
MSAKKNAPGATGALRDQLDGGSTHSVARVKRAHPMIMATRGRVEFAVRCPECGHLHRHVNLGIVDAPCGTSYNLGPRRGRVQ